MLAIDLGGTRVKAALVQDGRVGDVVAIEHDAATIDEALACVGDVVARLAPGGCASVGMCVPGLVDGGRIVALPGKLAGAVGADLVGWLAARTGGTALVVNDAQAYGVGEAAGEPGRVVVMTIGTGVGTAVIEEGRPLGAGPLGGGTLGGQLPLSLDGPPDTSGQGGTIEGWCRAERLLAEVRTAGCDVPDVRAACDAAATGNPAAVEGLAVYRGWLARGIAALCLAYGPRLVVVGGGPVRADGLLLDGLPDLVAPLLWAGQEVDIRAAAHGDAAALLGLAVMAAA